MDGANFREKIMSFTIRKSNDSFQIDYSLEKEEDKLLRDIKNVCFSYLDEPETARNIDMERLFAMHSFLSVKYQDVNSLKNSLNLNSYSWPFFESAQLIDNITMSDTIYSTTTEKNLFLLTKEVNYLMESIGFCYGIIQKISNEREELNK